MKEFSEVQSFLDNIPNINEGGCGLAALSMYRWLEKNKNINIDNVVITYLYNQRNCYINNKNLLRGENGKLAVPSHVCLRINKEYVDSTGSVDLQDYVFVQHINSIDFLIRTLNNPEYNGWNNDFYRTLNIIQKIEDNLNIDLSDVKSHD